MPKTNIMTIVKRNEQFASLNREVCPRDHIVCVFTGAMSGIGYGMLARMVLASYHSTVFYVLWKSSEKSNAYRKMVFESSLNGRCKIIFIDADVSLISDMDAASRQILAAENKVDYLCMSKNDIPLDETATFNYLAKENPEITFILSPLGFNKTGNSLSTDEPESEGIYQRAYRSIVNIRLTLSQLLFGIKPDKALERHIYYLTSSTFGPGPFEVDGHGEIMPLPGADKSRLDALWKYTGELWEKALSRNTEH
ncbi:hypothetical protein F4859DRAFT_516927 [Xylaria cf. heliscus]|nr:hypothetical protein F4859DRAFT_516927 [Xylaria cf. heliscus]